MGAKITQVLQERFRTIGGPMVTGLDVPEVRSSISRPELRKRRFCIEDGLVIPLIGRRALVDRLGVGGGRIQTG